PGMAYEFDEDDSGEGVPRGLLTGKTAVVFNTSNTAEQREKDFFGDPLDLIWKKCVFEFCGIETYLRRTFSVVVTSSPDLRKQWLDEVSSVVVKYFTPHRK
ncbi:MAG TPA: NAD(P)H-dependent oxidoreductase, partial [Spirochaetota bacterium]|nr:NAD(P)H-dependent oxidoreductase [Spirochaetota bacterium]